MLESSEHVWFKGVMEENWKCGLYEISLSGLIHKGVRAILGVPKTLGHNLQLSLVNTKSMCPSNWSI